LDNFSRGSSDAGVAVAIAVAVSPFGFDSFIKIYEEPRKCGTGLALGFLEFVVSRFKSVSSIPAFLVQ